MHSVHTVKVENLTINRKNSVPSHSYRVLTPFKPSVRSSTPMVGQFTTHGPVKSRFTRPGGTPSAISTDTDWTIVGGGRVGEALYKMGSNDTIIRRGDTIVDSEDGPIIVCTRNDDLQGVLEATPPSRYEDLVFIQNGMLEPWLADQGLADNTQVLVYFAVAKLGDLPADGKTDVNPEGLTAACGKHAQAFADRLATHNLSCKVLNKTAFRKSMLEKLVWISAFMLVGVKHKCSVGDVESKHKEEVEKLITELAAAGSQALNVHLDEGILPRLCAYAKSVAHYPTAIKEFEWRNGYFYNLSKDAQKTGKQDPAPYHTQLLAEVGVRV